MKHPLVRAIWNLLASRALTPVVVGLFLLLYVMIAFSVDDALTALINVTKSNVLLIVLFALIPVNRALRLVGEVVDHVARRRLMRGRAGKFRPDLFDETVEIEGTSTGFANLEQRLVGSGYTTRSGEHSLAAWRGISAFPSRALFLMATVCLFCGILISLGGRSSYRGTIIEGEPLAGLQGEAAGGVVERIALEKSAGPFLGKNLSIELAPANGTATRKSFGLYPPSRYQGAFVYPRYLGIGLYYRLRAPDIPGGYESRSVLSIYPPGKEDGRDITGTSYRVVFSIVQPADGSDPYMTGQFAVNFKLLKGDAQLFSGSAPAGGGYEKDGYRIEFPDIRRAVITDFIIDAGVYLVWFSALLLTASFCIWLLLRAFSPLREMIFISGGEVITASSRSEGRGRNHAGLFHELLDSVGSPHEAAGFDKVNDEG